MAYLVDPRVWDDNRFCQLTEGAQLTWFACLTGPQRKALPGLFRAGVATIAETRRRPVEQVHSELQQMAALEMIQFDPTVNVLRIPNAPRFASAPNRNILRSWFRQWGDVPDCALKYMHLDSLRQVISTASGTVAEEWGLTFGAVMDQIAGHGHTLESYCHGLQSTFGAPAVQGDLFDADNGAARRVQ